MKHYFTKFINWKFNSIDEKEINAYSFILWTCLEYINVQAKLSDMIKEELKNGEFLSEISKIKYLLSKISTSNSNDRLISSLTDSTLKSIQIKNFKGFGDGSIDDNGCNIELHSNNTIIFAPNGGGKTSFCEALEFELTGDIKEAKKRGYKGNIKEYFNRNSEKKTLINIQFHNSEIDPTKFDDRVKKTFETCFIEKNRIQEFALLGIDKKEEKNIIATLFGLEDLDNLVGSNNFVLPISFKLQELKEVSVQNQIDNLIKTNVENITKKQERIALIKEKTTEIEAILLKDFTIEYFTEITSQIKHEIEVLIEEIKALQPKPLKFHSQNEILDKIQQVEHDLNLRVEILATLNDKKKEINYKVLYEAVKNIESTSVNLEICPLCETPLSNVTRNPFENANTQLKLLKDIVDKEEVKEKNKNILLNHYNIVTSFLKDVKDNILTFNTLENDLKNKIDEFRSIIFENPENLDNKIILLKNVCEYITQLPVAVINYFTQINVIQKNLNDTSILLQKQNNLDKIKDKLKTLEIHKQDLDKLNTNLSVIEKELHEFSQNLEELNKKLILENHYNDFVDSIEKCYKTFHKDLQDFKSEEERNKFYGIEIPATKYYQQINKFDSEAEMVEKIVFEKGKENYRIKVVLKNQNQEVDAFERLSEGHIRALGLSMMLAVAEKEKKPFLVFDDVVNAIDSDHRANIIEMFFENVQLKNKQLIVTTHDRLFWERFCNFNNVHKSYSSYIFDYSKLIGVYHINYDVSFKDKIIKALEMFDIRQALVYSRIWFETLVTEYCLENEIEINAKFSVRHKEKNNLIRVNLEHIYRVVRDDLKNRMDIETTVYNKLYGSQNPNWQGMNQENHSLDEMSLNFSHSKTSHEIKDIFDNIQKFEILLFPRKLEGYIQELEKEHTLKSTRISSISNKLSLNNDALKTKNIKLYEQFQEEKQHLEIEVLQIEQNLIKLRKNQL